MLCILGRLILKRTVYSLLWLHVEFGQGEKLAGNLESVLVPPLPQARILSRQVIRGHSSAPLTLFYNSGSLLALVATPSYCYLRLAVASPQALLIFVSCAHTLVNSSFYLNSSITLLDMPAAVICEVIFL